MVPTSSAYNATNAAICAQYFVDPSDVTPTDPGEYTHSTVLSVAASANISRSLMASAANTLRRPSSMAPPPPLPVYFLNGEVGAVCRKVAESALCSTPASCPRSLLAPIAIQATPATTTPLLPTHFLIPVSVVVETYIQAGRCPYVWRIPGTVVCR